MVVGPQTSHTSQDTKWDKHEGSRFSREGEDQPPAGPQKQIPKSQFQDLILTGVSDSTVRIWKEKNDVKSHIPPFTSRHGQRPGRADSSEDSYPLMASAGFLRILSVGSGASGISKQVSSWTPETTEGKISFPSTPYSECSAETLFSLEHLING